MSSATVGITGDESALVARLNLEQKVRLLTGLDSWVLYGESEVLDKRESASKPDRGIVHIETRGFNQKGERVIVLRRSFLAPKNLPG